MFPLGAIAVQPQSTPAAQVSNRIDTIVRNAMTSSGIPGYSLVVVKDGKILHQAGYGFADQAKKTPVTPRTIFGLASVTKTFTALALLSLVDSGKLNLDDTLDKHIGKLPNSWNRLTIRQLATMTAGIPTGISKERAWPEEMAIIQRQPLMFKPGSRYCYSNPCYRTLGTVIENVAGKPYLTCIEDIILKPLSMAHTGTREQFAGSGLVSQPLGVNRRTGQMVLLRYKPTDISFASGLLFSNSEDMAKYAQALLERKLLSPSSYKTMLLSRPKLASGAASQWAFGWGSSRKKAYGGKLACGAIGGNPGVSSSILLLPEDKMAIVGLSNAYSPAAYNIPRMVAQAVLQKDISTETERGELQELSF
jgi:CubicO group peptidase (beta-lactamase class C family)